MVIDMAVQESRLVIAIDATKAQQQAKSLDAELKKLATSGDKTSNTIGNIGKTANNQSNNLKNFAQNIRNVANQSTKMATAIAAAATALGGFSVAYAKNVKDMTNMAQLADANTTEFQRMAIAAQRYGVTQDQLSNQIKDFNEKLGEFILTGKGEGVDAFETLHKHAKMTTAEISKFALEMQKASGPQALLMYVEKLEKAGVSQEQMSFLVENMGNDFTKILPILRNGGKELNALADEAQRLGVILDEEAIAQALELEKQINQMQMQAKGATNQFMTGFIPAVLQLSGAFGETANNSELLKQAGADMGQTLKVVASIAMGAYVAISSVARAITGVAKDALEAKKAISGGDSKWSDWVGLNAAKNLLTMGLLTGSGAGGNTTKAANKNYEVAESYAEFQKKLFDDVEKSIERTNKATENLGKKAGGITAGLTTFAEDMAKEAEKEKKEQQQKTKELEKQQKILQVNAKVMQLSSKYAISAKAAAAGIPEGVIEAMIMQESRGDTYRNGKLLTSKAGAQGLGQFMPGTAKQYGVDVRSEESSIKGMIKYMSDLIKQFGGDIDKAIMAYNAGPGNVRSGKAYGFKETQGYLKNVKAYAAGITGFAGEAKDFDSILKESNALLAEQANMRKQLELEVADRITQIRSNLADKLEEIDEANFTPEKAAELKSKYEYQANTEIAIYKQSLVTKLNEYEAFQKSEFKLLEESFNEKKFYTLLDNELTAAEREKALQLLDKQYKLEFMKLDLAKQQRIHAVREQFMDETTAMQERYRLERAEIEFTNNESERAALMQLSHLKEREEIMKRIQAAQVNWSGIQNTMRGTGSEEQQIWDTQFSRTEASSELFNSQLAGAGSLEEREALHQAHQDRLTEIERNANQARLDLNMSYGEQIMGSMSSIAKDMLGEQSATYKALFAVEKGFAMARATLNFASAYSSAFSDPTALTTAQKFANYAALAAAGSQIISSLASVTATGFANGGYTGNGGKHEVAGLVHKGEVVFSQADVKNAGGVQAVENLRKYGKGSSGVLVSIENYGTSKDFEVQQIDENQIRIIARDEAQKTVVSDLRNPNSKISSTLKQTKNVVERR